MQNNFFKANLPLFLTLSRLLIGSIVIPILYCLFLPLNIFSINILLAFIFALFSFTDFLDGYFARKFNLVTDLGKALDPIADKLFINSALIALLDVQRLFVAWVIILISRELLISGIRLIALQRGFDIAVSAWGKLKTASQIIMIILIVLDDNKTSWLYYMKNIFIALTIVLSIISAFLYLKNFLKKYNYSDEQKEV